MGVSISKSDSMILNAQHVFLYFNNPIKTSIETVKAELTQLVENTGAPETVPSTLFYGKSISTYAGFSHPQNYSITV